MIIVFQLNFFFLHLHFKSEFFSNSSTVELMCCMGFVKMASVILAQGHIGSISCHRRGCCSFRENRSSFLLSAFISFFLGNFIWIAPRDLHPFERSVWLITKSRSSEIPFHPLSRNLLPIVNTHDFFKKFFICLTVFWFLSMWVDFSRYNHIWILW